VRPEEEDRTWSLASRNCQASTDQPTFSKAILQKNRCTQPLESGKYPEAVGASGYGNSHRGSLLTGPASRPPRSPHRQKPKALIVP